MTMTNLFLQLKHQILLQTCTEIVMPTGVNNNDTLFELSPFDMNNYSKECQEFFGVTPTQFGGNVSSSTQPLLFSLLVKTHVLL